MKKAFLLSLLFLLFLSSCPAEPLVVDSKIFTNFPPFTLEEDDIVLVQNPSPLTIEIWNSETNKLKNRYVFKKEVDTSISETGYAYLSAIDYDMIGDDIWLIAEYAQCNLIKFNITTGELNFVARNVNDYDTLKIISKEEDNLGTVWISQFMQPLSGGFVRCYDLSGKLLHKFEIKAEDTDLTIKSLKFDDMKYSALCTYNSYYIGNVDKTLNKQDKIRKIEFDLIDKSYVFKPVAYSNFFPDEFLDKYNYIPEKFNLLSNSINDNFQVFFLIMHSNDNPYRRVPFLYYYDNTEKRYEFLKSFDSITENKRIICFIGGDKTNYNIIGMDSEDNEYYYIDNYKNNTLTTRYRIKGLRGEQLPKTNCALQWFGCGNDTTFSSVYIYDWQNNKVYLLQDGGEKQDISSRCKIEI